MRKSIFLFGLLVSFSFYSALAQGKIPIDSIPGQALVDTSWTSEFSAGLNFNQAAFSGNWKSGGINSIAFGSIIAGTANYEKDKITWDNELELLFGIVNNEGDGSRKSNDRIFLDSKVGYKLTDKWGAYFSLNFLSQFAKGYHYNEDRTKTLISDFMSPGFLTSSFGMEYKPNQDFALRLSPFSPRFTFVTDKSLYLSVPENYGVPIGESVRTEWLAMQLFATYNKDITETINIKSRYQLFANYETLAWENIDHRLDVTLTAKITNLINVTLTSINLYDIDQDPGVQYSQALALGILYKVSNKK